MGLVQAPLLLVKSRQVIGAYDLPRQTLWSPLKKWRCQGVQATTPSKEINCNNERGLKLKAIAEIVFRRKFKYLGTYCNIAHLPEGNSAVPEIMILDETTRFNDNSRTKEGLRHSKHSFGTPSSTANLLRMIFHRSKHSRTFDKNHPRTTHANSTPTHGIRSYLVDKCFYISIPPRVIGNHVWFKDVLRECCLLFNYVAIHPNLRQIYYVLRVHGGQKNIISPRDVDTLVFLTRDMKKYARNLPHDGYFNETAHNSFLTILLIDADSGSVDPLDVTTQLRHRGIEAPVIGIGMKSGNGIETLRVDMLRHCASTIPSERLSLMELKRMNVSMLNAAQLQCLYHLVAHDPQAHMRLGVSEICMAQRKIGTYLAATEGEERQLQWKAFFSDERPSGLSLSSEAKSNDISTKSIQNLPILAKKKSYSENSVATVSEGTKTLFQRECKALSKKLGDGDYLSYIHRVSPMRNPLLLPWYIHPFFARGKNESNEVKSQISALSPCIKTEFESVYRFPSKNSVIRVYDVRCPIEPLNPFLSPARFVSHRVDFCYKLPNQRRSRSRQRVAVGEYYFNIKETSDQLPNKYSLPYFPNFIPISFRPVPATDFIEYLRPVVDEHWKVAEEFRSISNRTHADILEQKENVTSQTSQGLLFSAAQYLSAFVDINGKPLSSLYLAAGHAGMNIRDFYLKLLNPSTVSHKKLLDVGKENFPNSLQR